MENRRYELRLFADYFQFYICDGEFQTDTGTLWDETSTDRMLAAGPDLIAVGTARNMDVPVVIEILDSEPSPDLSEWDQVIECGVTLNSGTLIALGCTDSLEDAARFTVTAGKYAARVSYANLSALSDDGLEGDDRYRIQLWPGSFDGIDVVKCRSE